ncbi:hypothetical protein [Azospirillum argentinense]|uniref:hypothetical protein n=1 Tax=Azospirillum argentinense TaxID=2970906 RepID=UPI0011AF617A|nr:hypothetical protein [Azospirillum argentinense]
MMDDTGAPSGREPSGIASLPFVYDGLAGRRWWIVKPTGDYMEDGRTGELYGLAFLDLLAQQEERLARLSFILRDMQAVQDRSGIAVGFISVLDDALRLSLHAGLNKRLRSFYAERHEQIVRNTWQDRSE